MLKIKVIQKYKPTSKSLQLFKNIKDLKITNRYSLLKEKTNIVQVFPNKLLDLYIANNIKNEIVTKRLNSIEAERKQLLNKKDKSPAETAGDFLCSLIIDTVSQM